MIYANDLWLPMPVKDLFDTQIMAMAIDTAKDMYNKGLKQIDDYYNKYSNFYTPITKDMESYNKLVIKPVLETMDYLYSNGIDPASSQGRAMLGQVIRSIPVGDVNALRNSAEIAKEFVKNKGLLDRKGLYSKEQDMFAGAQLEDWDTLAQNALFNRQSPIKAKSLNQLIDPIVSKIKPHILSKDEVESRNYTYNPMYDYTGITEKDIRRSLGTDIAGLLSDPTFAYWKDQAKKELIASGNTRPSEELIMDQMVNDATRISMQYATPLDYKVNPIAEAQYKDKLARARDYLNHVWRLQETRNNNDLSNQYSFLELVKRNTISNILGKTPQEYLNGDAKSARNAQLTFGREVSKKYKGNSTKGIQDFINVYGNTSYNINDLATFMNFSVDTATGSLIMPSTKLNRLYSRNSVVTHTTGYRNAAIGTNRTGLNNANAVRVVPTGQMYGALMKDGKFKNYIEVSVQKYKTDEQNQLSADGAPEIMYYDTNITSLSTPGAGSLGPQNPKNKNRTTLYNLPATDVHDSRYQDAVIGGKNVTDSYLHNTDYSDDIALTDIE